MHRHGSDRHHPPSPQHFRYLRIQGEKKQDPKREKIQLMSNAQGQRMHSAGTNFYEILWFRIKNVYVNFNKCKVAGRRKQGQIINRAL